MMVKPKAGPGLSEPVLSPVRREHSSPEWDIFSVPQQKWEDIPAASKKIFAAAFIANLVAYGFIFANLTVNHDGFGAISAGGSVHRVTGRWVADLVYINLLGGREIIWLYDLLGVLLFILTGFAICRVLEITDTLTRAVVVLVYTLFPYACSFYAYAYYVPIYGLAALASVSAVELCKRPGIRWKCLGTLCVLASLGCYQAFIASTLTLICLLAAVRLRAARSWQEAGQTLIREVLPQAGAAAAGALLYSLSVRVSTTYFGVVLIDYQGANSMLSASPASVLRGVARAIDGTRHFLGFGGQGFTGWYENPYFTTPLRALCAGVVAVTVWGVWKRSAFWVAGTLAGAFVILAAIAPRSVQTLHPDANYHEMALSAYAVFLSGIFALALKLSPRLPRIAVQLIAIVLLAKFIHSDNVAAMSLTLDYQATMHWANRVLARVEGRPEYVRFPPSEPKRFVFVGDNYGVSRDLYRGLPFVSSTGISDGTPGIVFADLFRLLRVNATTYGIDPETHRRALEYASAHNAWPAEDAVTILDNGTIVVVLDKSELPASPPR